VHFRPSPGFFRALAIAVAVASLLAVDRLAGQNAPSTLTVLSRDARRAIPISSAGGQERLALDDLASAFQLAVREEAGALTVSYKGQLIVLTADQAMASVAGRLVSLSVPPTRTGGRWLVPLDFINRALGPIYDSRLDLRRATHLLVVGDIRVPRVMVRQEAVGAGGRITIEATPRAGMTAAAEGNQRILVKFDAEGIDPLFPPLQPQGLITGIRVADATTLAIDLAPKLSGFRSSIQPADSSTRLLLDLGSPSTDQAAVAPTAPQTPSPQAPPPPLPDGQPVLPTFELPAVRTIAIDAGHGGPDAGGRGPKGTLEKDVTLNVARRLKAAIEGRLGLRVIMTREDDRLVPLDDRTATANYNKADLFLSLHTGASFRTSVTGAEVYLAAFDESSTPGATLIPERVPAFGGSFRDIELVPWSLAQIRYNEPSEQIATLVVQHLQGQVPLAPGTLQRTPLRILKSANMPAVLIEIGYLTNPDQERQMAGADFQNRFVQAIVDAITKFRDASAPSEGSLR
jgi:N-acetylmuramoyl-L-alanine amidase